MVWFAGFAGVVAGWLLGLAVGIAVFGGKSESQTRDSRGRFTKKA